MASPKEKSKADKGWVSDLLRHLRLKGLEPVVILTTKSTGAWERGLASNGITSHRGEARSGRTSRTSFAETTGSGGSWCAMGDEETSTRYEKSAVRAMDGR